MIPFGSLAITVDVGVVVAEAAHALGTTTEALISDDRSRHVSMQRHIAMAAARRLGWSYPVIGRYFGKDHTSVLHACRRVEADPQMNERARIIAEHSVSERSLF